MLISKGVNEHNILAVLLAIQNFVSFIRIGKSYILKLHKAGYTQQRPT